ncbi:hypothetical protein PENTCL1PPCAC_14568, partial [Pristionchus entomophagus]
LASRFSISDGSCDCEEMENQLKIERRSDENDHACRSCKVPDISPIACPAIGYQCDEGWGISTNKLSADDDCVCLQTRCAGVARLAVNGTIVDKMRCNAREWMAEGEIVESVVCARACDKGVCKASTSRAPPEFADLIVNSAEGETKCATGHCIDGSKLAALYADGTLKKLLDPVLEVTCSGDGRWVYGDGEDEKAWYVMCVAEGASFCRTCAKDLITITMEGNGAKEMHSDIIDIGTETTCARRTFTCIGPNSNIEVNNLDGVVKDGDDNHVDGSTTLVLNCNPGGTGWTYNGEIVYQVECAAGNPTENCKNCAKELITVTADGNGAKEMYSDIIDRETRTCAVRTFTCLGTNSNIEVNNHAGVAKDVDDGVIDGKTMFTVTCNGAAWMSSVFPVTQVECATADPVTQRCHACARDFITIMTSGQGAKPMTTDVIFDSDPKTCVTRTFTCIGKKSSIEVNTRDGVVNDVDDGHEDGTTSMVLICNAAGTGWLHSGKIVTQAECSTADAEPPTPGEILF